MRGLHSSGPTADEDPPPRCLQSLPWGDSAISALSSSLSHFLSLYRPPIMLLCGWLLSNLDLTLSCCRCGSRCFLHPLAAWCALLYIGAFRSLCVAVLLLRPVVPEVWLTSYSPISSLWLSSSLGCMAAAWFTTCFHFSFPSPPVCAIRWICAVSPSSGRANPKP